jgi:hypothetical protein
MTHRFAFLLLFSAVVGLKASTPPLLETAINKLAASDDEWAYTQVFHRTDTSSGDTVAKFDPSRPAGAQWQLMKLRGKTPSDSEAVRWCKRRSQDSNQSDSRAFIDLLDLGHASIIQQNDGRVKFEIPLKKNTIAHVPTENFVAYAEVNPTEEILQSMSVVLKQAIRLVGGIAQVESAEGEVFFQTFGGSEEARPTHIIARGTGQALFRKVNRSAEIIFLDQRRVKS